MITGKKAGTTTVTITDSKTGSKASIVVTISENQTIPPEITLEVFEDVVFITATGEGEVLLQIDGTPTDNPAMIERGDEDCEVIVSATAQAEGMSISNTRIQVVTIPALDIPIDPYFDGTWLVAINNDGNAIYHQLVLDSPDFDLYQATIKLSYSEYGVPNGNEWYDVLFYIFKDGVCYGPKIDNTVPVYGDASQNRLYPNDNFWNIPVGSRYTFGVYTSPDTGYMYLSVTPGPLTGD